MFSTFASRSRKLSEFYFPLSREDVRLDERTPKNAFHGVMNRIDRGGRCATPHEKTRFMVTPIQRTRSSSVDLNAGDRDNLCLSQGRYCIARRFWLGISEITSRLHPAYRVAYDTIVQHCSWCGTGGAQSNWTTLGLGALAHVTRQFSAIGF